MPFITKEQRKKLDEDPLVFNQPGDLTYLQYVKLIKAWRKERRWTTAHNLTKELFGLSDHQCAKLMAWQVFMDDEVMPYEQEKKKLNGKI